MGLDGGASYVNEESFRHCLNHLFSRGRRNILSRQALVLWFTDCVRCSSRDGRGSRHLPVRKITTRGQVEALHELDKQRAERNAEWARFTRGMFSGQQSLKH